MSARERRNLTGRGYPRSDIRSTYSRRAFSSRGVRYCWLAALSLREGLPLAWRHNVVLLGCDDTGSVLRFVVLPRATCGKICSAAFLLAQISSIVRAQGRGAAQAQASHAHDLFLGTCEER